MSLDCIPISFPLQSFQQQCEAQPTATLGMPSCPALIHARISKATESSAGEKTATQCCHAAANTAEATQAGTGGWQDSGALDRDTLQEGKLETVLDQIQLRFQSNGSTPVPVQDKKSSLNELAVQVHVLSASTSS